MPFVSLNIRAKLAGSSFALVSAVVFALTLQWVAAEVAMEEKELQAKALAYGQHLAKEAEPAIAFDDAQTTREILEATSLDPEVASMTLYKSNGAVLGAIGEPMIAPETVHHPELRQTETVLAVLAPVISKEGPRGTLVVELSRNGILEQKARGKRDAAFAGLLAAAIGLAASWLIGGSFARRVRKIQRATQAFEAGNLDVAHVEDGSKDEIGQLAGAFNVMADHIREEATRLDRLVVTRTQELQKKNADLAFLLDNVGQGFVTVDKSGKLAAERSAILARWFGAQPANTTLWEYIAADDVEASQWLAVGWDALFDGMLPEELALDQLPKEIRRGDSTYGVRYQPIGESVIVVVSDVTAEIARRKAEAKQRELAEVFGRLVADPAAVEQFIAEGGVLVRSIQDRNAALAEVQRWLHTLKGNSAFLGLERMAATCHEMETRIAEGDAPSAKLVQTLAQLWAELTASVEPLTSGRRDRTMVRTAALRRHVDAIQAGRPRRWLVNEVETWLLEPTATRLERAAAQAVVVATRLDKPEPTITIEHHDLNLDAQTWGGFWTAFVHVVRNAVDHGIESPDVRIARGKPAAGAITLRTFERADELIVEIEDDGAGIDWDALRERTGAEELVSALFEDGVTTKSDVTDTSGRGIGLGAARAAAAALGGRVDVRSERGRGCAFTFSFPRDIAAESVAA
jgi:two-component system chemotaxis sensor kinase CheA